MPEIMLRLAVRWRTDRLPASEGLDDDHRRTTVRQTKVGWTMAAGSSGG